MIEREKLGDDILLKVNPLGTLSRCQINAVLSVRPGRVKRDIRIFIRDLDVKGLTVSEAVLLMTALRSIIDESGTVAEGGRLSSQKNKLAAKPVRKATKKRAKK